MRQITTKDIVIIFTLLLCNICGTYCQDISTIIGNQKSIENFVSNEWKKDSIGCLGIRKQLADSVIFIINNDINSVQQLIGLLGNPNFESETDSLDNHSSINYHYYTDVLCDSSLTRNTDWFCYLLIYFEKSKPDKFGAFQMCN